MRILIATDDVDTISKTLAEYAGQPCLIQWAMPNTVATRTKAVSLGLGEFSCVGDANKDDYDVVVTHTPTKPAKVAKKPKTLVKKNVEAKDDDKTD
jgi:hypothetical protein